MSYAGGMGRPTLWGADRLNVYTGGNPVQPLQDGTSRDITAGQGAVIDGPRFGVAVVATDARLVAIIGVAGDGTEGERLDRRHLMIRSRTGPQRRSPGPRRRSRARGGVRSREGTPTSWTNHVPELPHALILPQPERAPITRITPTTSVQL